MEIPILYEDNHLLVVEKPVNVPVQADNSQDADLLTLLKNDLKIRYQKPGNVYLGLVHRLDRPVGGAIVFAKTSKAAARLSDQLRRNNVSRNYVAIVRGTLPQETAKLEHYLFKNRRENKVYTVPSTVKDAKKAILEYRKIAEMDGLTLVEVKLKTGRSHQIRVQFSTIGCPIYGDQKYGSTVNRPGQQIALWSYKLQFEHPTKKEMITIVNQPADIYPWNIWGSIL